MYAEQTGTTATLLMVLYLIMVIFYVNLSTLFLNKTELTLEYIFTVYSHCRCKLLYKLLYSDILY